MATTEKLVSIVKQVDEEVHLCLICCSVVKCANNDSQLIEFDRNLIVFYLLSKVLHVDDKELKKNLISCGNPGEWIKLCDKCGEFSGQAVKLHWKLKKIERELNCVHKLIWDKVRLSVNCERNKEVVEGTIDLSKTSALVWRRIRDHVTNKSKSRKSILVEEPVNNPFQEGDKLANYLITEKTTTAFLLIDKNRLEHSEENDCLVSEEDPYHESTAYMEEMDQDYCVEQEDKNSEEEDVDWNWEPGGEDEVDEEKMNEENSEKDDTGKVNLTNSATKRKRQKVNKVKLKRIANFKCRHCDQTFVGMSGRNLHEREKHPKTPGAFTCDICSKAFNSRCYLRKHKFRIHKLKREDEDEHFRIKSRKRMKTEDGKFQCRFCDRIFESASGCSVHEHEKHSTTPAQFVCDICGRAYNSKRYLRNHKIISHRVKFDGTPIPKSDTTNSSLLKLDQICEQCGKGFKTGTELSKHVRFVHEKRFGMRCSLCGMGWSNSNALNKHILAKHPEDPLTKKLIEEEGIGLWKCPVVGCTVTFLKEGGLKGHLKSIHGKMEGDMEGMDSIKELVEPKKGKVKGKEFWCDICGNGFTARVSLKEHLKIHEKDYKRDYFCDNCGRGFNTEKYLRKHKRRTRCGQEGIIARAYSRQGEKIS